MGVSSAGREYRDTSALPDQSVIDEVSTMPCGQWYDLHILANGYTTKCCIDESGHNDDAKYDTRTRNVLEIYRENSINRCNLPARKDVKGCVGCLFFG